MKKKADNDTAAGSDFEALVVSIVQIHQQTREFATRAVNVGLTLRNWLIGRHIVEFEQNGADRAAYGESLIDALSRRLATNGLPRVTPRELRRYRQFYLVYPQIWESVTPKSLETFGFAALLPLALRLPPPIRESLTPQSPIVEAATPQLEAFLKQLGKEIGHAS